MLWSTEGALLIVPWPSDVCNMAAQERALSVAPPKLWSTLPTEMCLAFPMCFIVYLSPYYEGTRLYIDLWQLLYFILWDSPPLLNTVLLQVKWLFLFHNCNGFIGFYNCVLCCCNPPWRLVVKKSCQLIPQSRVGSNQYLNINKDACSTFMCTNNELTHNQTWLELQEYFSSLERHQSFVFIWTSDSSLRLTSYKFGLLH